MGLLAVLSGPFGMLAFAAFALTIGLLINLALLVATIVIIYFCVQPGTPGDNAYGAPPPVWTPGPAAA
ncbi:MAG: hypothetical protein ACREHE_05195 [Rhizomicrobium sp.]